MLNEVYISVKKMNTTFVYNVMLSEKYIPIIIIIILIIISTMSFSMRHSTRT